MRGTCPSKTSAMSFARDPKYTEVVAQGRIETVDGKAKDRKGTPAKKS